MKSSLIDSGGYSAVVSGVSLIVFAWTDWWFVFPDLFASKPLDYRDKDFQGCVIVPERHPTCAPGN